MGDLLPVKGVFSIPVALNKEDRSTSQVFNVTDIPELYMIGRTMIVRLGIDVNRMLQEQIHILFSGEQSIQKNCENLCLEFQELFKPELGCLKDFELEIRFKPDSKPIFRKCCPVPFAILEDVNQALDTGIQKGVWIPTDFNDYGTPIVPVMKKSVPKSRIQLRICGDYSNTVNPQLETHRHPMPVPEDLMTKLSGSQYFSKIDLADAYNQIKLTPES